MSYLRAAVERQWYGKPTWLLLLTPLVPLFIVVSIIRRFLLTRTAQPLAAPVIVVGNIAVGGTGKTPVIIGLIRAFKACGFNPGVIARGYGVNLVASQILPEHPSPTEFGDEPVFVARAAACPVAVGPNRVDSAKLLIQKCGCDIVLSDDGLQHYRLHRDMEIAVIDGSRGLGNGWRLPVGPLREGSRRLREVDFVLINGSEMSAEAPSAQSYHFVLRPVYWRNVQTYETRSLTDLSMTNAVAIAGIGNPQRFFDTLASLGFCGVCRSFPDHHAFSASDLQEFGSVTILMTEKDAVKCREFAQSNWWALCVEAELPEAFLEHLRQSL